MTKVTWERFVEWLKRENYVYYLTLAGSNYATKIYEDPFVFDDDFISSHGIFRIERKNNLEIDYIDGTFELTVTDYPVQQNYSRKTFVGSPSLYKVKLKMLTVDRIEPSMEREIDLEDSRKIVREFILKEGGGMLREEIAKLLKERIEQKTNVENSINPRVDIPNNVYKDSHRFWRKLLDYFKFRATVSNNKRE